MIAKLLIHDGLQSMPPKEGDLYKEVTVGGKSFRLCYGYYEAFERESPLNDPMPIYPDFIKNPIYTDEGIPIVTAMQDVCTTYHGRINGDSCSDCVFFLKSEELFGLCHSPENRRSSPEGVNVQNE